MTNGLVLVDRKFNICGHEIIVNQPAREEDCLERAVGGTGVDPYWGKIWDAAIGSAHYILSKHWPPGSTAIELGCGIGLAGIAALKAGLDVTFSDHDPNAVQLALENAALNGFPDTTGVVHAWSDDIGATYDFSLASDVLYESNSHLPLLLVAEKVLEPEGKFFIGDPGRRAARNFLNLATDRGWKVRLFDESLNEVWVPSTNEFQWIELRMD